MIPTNALGANDRAPRVSVLLPTYERARYVEESVDSVLRQSFADLELIVVDDGSTDDTADRLSRIADPRLRYVRRDHGGAAAALNSGLGLARGEYVARNDSDDVWLPHLLATAVAVLDADPHVGLVYGRGESIDGAGTRSGGMKGFPLKFPRDAFRSLLYADYTVSVASVVRRACLDRVGPWDESLLLCEDWDLALRIARHYGVHFVDRVLVRIRTHAGNSTAFHDPSFERRLEHRERVLDKVFCEPGLAAEAAAMAPLAYRNVHIGAAMQYLSSGRRREALAAFRRALRAGGDPVADVARIGWSLLTWFAIGRYPWSRRLAYWTAARLRERGRPAGGARREGLAAAGATESSGRGVEA
jgi:GT2 family glycosyltransferase